MDRRAKAKGETGSHSERCWFCVSCHVRITVKLNKSIFYCFTVGRVDSDVAVAAVGAAAVGGERVVENIRKISRCVFSSLSFFSSSLLCFPFAMVSLVAVAGADHEDVNDDNVDVDYDAYVTTCT